VKDVTAQTSNTQAPLGYIPVGTELRTADGVLIAKVARVMYRGHPLAPDDFCDWQIEKPAPCTPIEPKVFDALSAMQAKYFGTTFMSFDQG
jgi:hypothetical protein